MISRLFNFHRFPCGANLTIRGKKSCRLMKGRQRIGKLLMMLPTFMKLFNHFVNNNSLTSLDVSCWFEMWYEVTSIYIQFGQSNMSVHCSSCHEQFCQALRDKCFELDYSELKMKYFTVICKCIEPPKHCGRISAIFRHCVIMLWIASFFKILTSNLPVINI